MGNTISKLLEGSPITALERNQEPPVTPSSLAGRVTPGASSDECDEIRRMQELDPEKFFESHEARGPWLAPGATKYLTAQMLDFHQIRPVAADTDSSWIGESPHRVYEHCQFRVTDENHLSGWTEEGFPALYFQVECFSKTEEKNPSDPDSE